MRLSICIHCFLEKCQRDRCSPNGILKIRNNLQSQNRATMLVLRDTGILEIWCKRQKLWTTDTNDSYVKYLFFKNDGKIYLIGKDNSSRWKTKTSLTNSKPQIMLTQNDGNVVIYDKCGNRIWQSGTGKTVYLVYQYTRYTVLLKSVSCFLLQKFFSRIFLFILEVIFFMMRS